MASSLSELAGALSAPIGKKQVECAKHGTYESTGTKFTIGKGREVWTPCQACKVDAEHERVAEISRAAAASKVAEMEALLATTAIPARFIGRSFDNYRVTVPGQAQALARCRHFVENFDQLAARGQSMVFSGKIGTGKSHLAAAILQALLPAHIGVYVTVSDLFRMVRDTWRSGSVKTETQVLAELAAIPLLVIDEVGLQRNTAEDHNLFFDIIDRRYRDKMPTILMTNEDKDGLKACVGDRVFDRLRETSRWVSFDWESSRPQARKDFE